MRFARRHTFLPVPPSSTKVYMYANKSTLHDYRIIAGSETTATFLTGALYLLLKNPSYLDRVKLEIRSSFKSEDDITFASVENLPYSM